MLSKSQLSNFSSKFRWRQNEIGSALTPLAPISCPKSQSFFFFDQSPPSLQIQLGFTHLVFQARPLNHASNSGKPSSESEVESIREGVLEFQTDPSQSQWNVEVGNPSVLAPTVAKLSLGDQGFYLMAFIACTTSVAFTSLVIAAVPTICAMGRAATSLSKLADTARQELPSTMAAIRLSGMEISDLTLELNDLSQEIAD